MPDPAAIESVHHTGNAAGNVSAGIDHGIPVAAHERRDIAVPVSGQYFDSSCATLDSMPAAVERRDVMTSRKGRIDEGATEENRSADEQNPHPSLPANAAIAFAVLMYSS